MWKEFQKKYSINDSIIKVMEDDMKFDKITKVQNVVIPNFIKNRDVIVKSCTGSGKTLSYLIPLFQKLIDSIDKEYSDSNDTNKIEIEKNLSIKNKILALIILPTRELAMQVHNILIQFTQRLKFSYALLIGGKKIEKDLKKLDAEIPNIIVATPGRIFDLDEKLNFIYRDLKILILDEADKMLEMGYEIKLTLLLGKLPKQRRTGLFSATINSQIENMIKVGMQNPIFVDIKINLDKDSDLYQNKINTALSENQVKKNKKKNKVENNQNNINILHNNGNQIQIYGKIEQTLESKNEIAEVLNEQIFIKSVDEDTSGYSKVIIIDSLSEKKEELVNFVQEIPHQLKQFYIGFGNVQDKLPYLIYLIKSKYNEKSKFIIFFATCNCVEYFAIVLPKILESLSDEKFKEKIKENINIFKLHSKITQKKRNLEYKKFLNCENGILLSTDLSARGIDVPNVDLIVQFDPPKNEEIYIHRVGRTARVGRQGISLIFISNEESSFINYMGNRKVLIDDIRKECDKKKSLENFQFETNVNFSNKNYFPLKSEIFTLLKDINMSDRWIYEKAVKAFISLIRFYQEHDLKYIFDVNKIDIGNIANTFKLLRLPRLREIIGKKIENFEQDRDINPKYLVYKDANVAKQMFAKEERLNQLKEERDLKRETAKINQEKGIKQRTKKEKKAAKIRSTFKEWDDFAGEEKLYKKYKQGKISKEEYDRLFLKNL